jgi:sugar/nucleoside kinase (ribokinase family)
MNIIVLGDIMLDINYFSIIERNAPEANIPIYDIQKTEYILGGAANVAQNLNNLNVNIELISLIGNDDGGKKIKNILEEKQIKHYLFIDEKRKTTIKNRITEHGPGWCFTPMHFSDLGSDASIRKALSQLEKQSKSALSQVTGDTEEANKKRLELESQYQKQKAVGQCIFYK